MSRVIAIDPGTTESGICVIDVQGFVPVLAEKLENQKVFDVIRKEALKVLEDGTRLFVAAEMFASYGMSVGQSTFQACKWLGRFEDRAVCFGLPFIEIFRKDVKMHFCGNMRAKDSNITQALVDRFAYDRHKAKGHGKGTKNDPGFFYGFAKDTWSAYAIGVTFIETKLGRY